MTSDRVAMPMRIVGTVLIAAAGGSAMADSRACLDEPVQNCIASLRAQFKHFPSQEIDHQLRLNSEADVNGRRTMPLNAIRISVMLPGAPFAGSLEIQYSDSDVVTRFEVELPSDPMSARTTEEYAQTRFSEAAHLALGDRCPELAPASLAKFFENTVKPKVESSGGQHGLRDTHLERASGIPLCGTKFDFVHTFGTDPEYVRVNNPHGAYSIPLIVFHH